MTARVPKDLENLNDRVFEELVKLKSTTTTILIDADANLANKREYFSSYYSKPEDLTFIKQGFDVEIKKRLNGERSTDDAKIVFINNLKAFITMTGLTDKNIRTMLSDGPKVNVNVIISSMYNDIIGTYDKETKLTRQIINQAVIVSRLYDQDFYRQNN